jgi:3-phenylpropionate/trans-cinnamate dioxygenase ferredoxin reductase component
VVALGAVRNVEWLQGSGLAFDSRGITCDAACRAFDTDGMVTENIFVAGDVARWPHPLYEGELLSVKHWGMLLNRQKGLLTIWCVPRQHAWHTKTCLPSGLVSSVLT